MYKYISFNDYLFTLNIEKIMSTAFIRNKKLGRGINIANALEAPREGDWDLYYFIKFWTNGFGNVRFPF